MNSLSRISRIRLCLGVCLFLLLGGIVSAQDQSLRSITYRLSMTRPHSHLFEVKIEVETPADFAGGAIDFQMPKWSPGRYAVFDFAKNVQEFQAAAGICPAKSRCDMAMRPAIRVDDQTWRVPLMNSSSLTISYKVFGDDLSGTFSQLNARHANFNGGTIFMYVVNHKQDPVILAIDPPKDWRIVNGLTDRPDQREWQFPNYDVLIDTATEIAPDWTEDTFKVDGKTYRVIVHSLGNEGGKRPALVRDLERIVRAENAMWGPPEFDSYTFLLHFAADDRSGDGMEHLNSTQIIMPGTLAEPGTYEEMLDAASHEFFHVWNVKRLRPLELGPWDFTRPANTRGLWIAEGFTNYYGHLMLRRAGIWDEARFLQRESETITAIENAPGSRLMSAEESSLSAPFIDDAPHAQRTNLANTAISYYPKGELLAFVLDLLIRGKSDGRVSLDDVMRRMYQEFYLQSPNNSYYLRGRGYKTEEFERVAATVAGLDLSDFFKRHVRGVEVPPYDAALAYVGLKLIREPASARYDAGISLERADQSSMTIAVIRPGSAAENAGLQVGDIIVSIGGTSVTRESWINTLSRYREGERVSLTLRRNRDTMQTSLTIGQPEHIEFRIEEMKDAPPEARALRAAWLKG
ncbi:MAG: PDZ domain-containing protein [Pyrinomonadaceae bacterium]